MHFIIKWNFQNNLKVQYVDGHSFGQMSYWESIKCRESLIHNLFRSHIDTRRVLQELSLYTCDALIIYDDKVIRSTAFGWIPERWNRWIAADSSHALASNFRNINYARARGLCHDFIRRAAPIPLVKTVGAFVWQSVSSSHLQYVDNTIGCAAEVQLACMWSFQTNNRLSCF